MTKGIILAGGMGSRLYPITLGVSKQLMPIYDKPMIYYPLAQLMSVGIRDILIITTPKDEFAFKRLLGDGSQWGCSFQFTTQAAPKGIAQAFLLAKDFIGENNVVLILGDNLFYGASFEATLKDVIQRAVPTIFGYRVQNPQRYGVVEFDGNNNVQSIQEKPKIPPSNYAVPGIYFYDRNVVGIAEQIKPSQRGELEITDVNNSYLDTIGLKVELLDSSVTWLDTGTEESFMEAAQFVQIIEKRQGVKICCPEEVAYRNNYINKAQFKKLLIPLSNSNYGLYLQGLLN